MLFSSVLILVYRSHVNFQETSVLFIQLLVRFLFRLCFMFCVSSLGQPYLISYVQYLHYE